MTPTPTTNTADSGTWTPRRWMRPRLVLPAVCRAGRLAAPRRRDRHSHGWASRVLVAPRGRPPGPSRRGADRLRGCCQRRIAVDRSGVGVGGALRHNPRAGSRVGLDSRERSMMHRQFPLLRLMCREVTQPARDRAEPKHKPRFFDTSAMDRGRRS